jgi:hypothetical protein
MNQKVMLTSTIQNQNYNSGKKPQNFRNIVPISIALKSTPNVLGLIKITKNLIYPLVA